eukprot:tig00001220_g7618.t1
MVEWNDVGNAVWEGGKYLAGMAGLEYAKNKAPEVLQYLKENKKDIIKYGKDNVLDPILNEAKKGFENIGEKDRAKRKDLREVQKKIQAAKLEVKKKREEMLIERSKSRNRREYEEKKEWNLLKKDAIRGAIPVAGEIAKRVAGRVGQAWYKYWKSAPKEEPKARSRSAPQNRSRSWSRRKKHRTPRRIPWHEQLNGPGLYRTVSRRSRGRSASRGLSKHWRHRRHWKRSRSITGKLRRAMKRNRTKRQLYKLALGMKGSGRGSRSPDDNRELRRLLGVKADPRKADPTFSRTNRRQAGVRVADPTFSRTNRWGAEGKPVYEWRTRRSGVKERVLVGYEHKWRPQKGKTEAGMLRDQIQQMKAATELAKLMDRVKKAGLFKGEVTKAAPAAP